MTATVLDSAGDQLGGFLPRLVGALALLIIGLLVVALLARAVRRGLMAAGLDDVAERWGVADVLERSGLGRSLSRIVGVAVRLTLSVVVIFAALTLLGLAFLSESLNQGILFMPKVLAALVLVLAGIVLGALARTWVERTSAQLDLPVPLGPVAQALVVAVFAITAAAQIAIPIGFLVVILAILLGATVGAVGLAFGLGGREIASSLSAARYVRAALSEGQTIRVGDSRGTVERIEAAATVLRNERTLIRIPNRRLVEETVVIEDAGPASS
jgi:small-conductance mechanosensitive channel